ncbi:MAG: glycine amidinotransferase, partial [Alphaproteobacteria bacterium]|nr:glycine amidinotransferase [Alphaproteobacteria bacterium]
MTLKVNAWTQWGKLKTIVVGKADFACFHPQEPGFKGKINNEAIADKLDWPLGRKKQSIIDKANSQLDNLATILTGLGINVLRPSPIDFMQEIKTPLWQVSNMFCCVCPRDVMITIGNSIIEATMSKRGRFFEYLPYRDIMYQLWDADHSMKWKAAPKPSMSSDMYWEGYWSKFSEFDEKSESEQYALLHDYKYVLNESEIAFDAADITRCGKDIFVQHSMTTNLRAVEWLRRELEGTVRVHVLNFPYDKEPSHIDCTFVPLRPPRNGQHGIALTNPERPLLEKDLVIFKNNNWNLIEAPLPNKINYPMPIFCQSSKWLSMNLLSIDENTVVVEENEDELHNVLEALDFNVIKIPYRSVFEFGGSIHC